MRRTQKKIITRANKILRYMRVSRRVSMREAGRRCNLSDSAISHYEHGRMELTDARIRQLVEAYGYSLADYQAFADGHEMPVLSFKDECVGLLDLIDEKKLKTVHAVLTGFLT